MSNIAPTVARQALRIASRRYPSSAFARASPRVAVVNGANARRSYVSETKPFNATVNMDAAVKADQKDFLKETGKRPSQMNDTGLPADAMLNPTAGMSDTA